ncbi:MAG: type II toxin-antitoxin system VapC family toxin [Propionibacteriaceae bacterium]|nr:type II toxin-antitoxin system VapC family toxin [Propionibacteriaceae bacterium]
MITDTIWVVDTSVVLRAMLGDSASARAWLDHHLAIGETIVGCRMLDLEVRRTIIRMEVRGVLTPGQVDPDAYLGRFAIGAQVDTLVDEAARLRYMLRASDALHVAFALSLGVEGTTIVTHDEEMATACAALGFDVIDPVGDEQARLLANGRSEVTRPSDVSGADASTFQPRPGC